MTRLLVGSVFAPFVVFYAWRAIRALRTGVAYPLGQAVTRAGDPERFWTAVARQVLWVAIVTTAGCLAVLGRPGPSVWWAAGAYALVYVGMHLAVAFFVRRARGAS